MQTIAEIFIFIVGWIGIMAVIGFICWAVGKWGKDRRKTDGSAETDAGGDDIGSDGN